MGTAYPQTINAGSLPALKSCYSFIQSPVCFNFSKSATQNFGNKPRHHVISWCNKTPRRRFHKISAFICELYSDICGGFTVVAQQGSYWVQYPPPKDGFSFCDIFCYNCFCSSVPWIRHSWWVHRIYYTSWYSVVICVIDHARIAGSITSTAVYIAWR